MPLVYVTRKAHFNAAHRLHNPDKSDEWNQRVFGKCNSPNWHGHNYTLEVTVRGEPNPETGYVIDLAELKRIMEERVISHCDHRNLNLDVDFLQGIMPSSENMVVAFWRRLEDAIPSGELFRVRLDRPEGNPDEYLGDYRGELHIHAVITPLEAYRARLRPPISRYLYCHRPSPSITTIVHLRYPVIYVSSS